ncbi:hypothetical protein PSAC2689_110118 [Paraburkholderia sacchari]
MTVNFALNDQFYHTQPVAGQPNVDPIQYMEIISKMVSEARAAGKQVVLYEPNPTKWQPAPGDLGSYVHALRQVAQQYNVPIVAKFDYLQTLPDWKTTLLSEDGVHPTDAGYEAIAEQEAKTLAPIVQSLLSH